MSDTVANFATTAIVIDVALYARRSRHVTRRCIDATMQIICTSDANIARVARRRLPIAVDISETLDAILVRSVA